MRRPLPATLIALSLALAACGDDPPAAPTAPDPGTLPDLSAQAFRVTLDIPAGQAVVAPPTATAARASGDLAPSFSLIGSEGIGLRAGAMTCVGIPKNREQKRCSFDLSLGNLFRETDLMTPTTFPKPPEGTDGVLVFPWTATATGGSGPVVPSPDWDYGPVNFFNDFGACSSGGKSDCIRYELISAPFYAGSGAQRRVGFDVPIAAERVTTYVLVAADLRENPVRTFQSPPILDRCGVVGQSALGDIELRMLLGATFGQVFRGFCTFNGLQSNVIIHNAILRMHKEDGSPGSDAGVEYLEYGETVDFEDYGLPATHEWHELNTAGRNLYLANLTDEVQEAHAAGARNFPFRFRMKHEEDTWASFAGWINIFPSPVLELTYTMK